MNIEQKTNLHTKHHHHSTTVSHTATALERSPPPLQGKSEEERYWATTTPTKMPSSSPKSVFHARPFPSSSLSSRRSTFLILSFIFLFGLSGFIFGLTAFFRPNRCLSARPRSVRVLWDHGGGGGGGAGNNRHKVMGFVGVFSGFRSVGRRQALRKTWFPSDPNGLQR